MELERWAELSAAISAVAANFKRHARDRYSTALIVRVHLWAALFDRPLAWACEAKNWRPHTRPHQLPGQSTMSRRTRRKDFEAFQALVGERMNGKLRPTPVRIIDGKALELSNHSADPDARWGRGVSRQSLGYKLHAVFSGNPMPDAFAVTALDVSEKRMAVRLIKGTSGWGYLLGDGHFDASWLFDYCRHHGLQLVCRRAKPGTGLGHRYVSAHRRRAIDLLEVPAALNRFGRDLFKRRTEIERQFSQLVSFGGGLQVLPTWVRRIWRVRNWVMSKLLINAARIRLNRKQAVGA
jgi:hypothetical protein